MADKTRWIIGRSAHAIRTWTRVPGRAVTRCGRTVGGNDFDDLRGFQGRTCENCLKLLAKDLGR